MIKRNFAILMAVLAVTLVGLHPVDARGLTPETQEKIAFVKEVKKFGEEILGIKPNRMYANFNKSADNKTCYLLYWSPKTTIPRSHNGLGVLYGDKVNIQDKDSFVLDTPKRREIGSGYSAFLAWDMGKEEIEKEKSSLREKHDIYEREIRARSGLKDLTPAFLKMERYRQVELTFHEGIHDMIDGLNLKDLDRLNILEEAIATVVGLRGTLLFLSSESNADMQEYEKARTRSEVYIRRARLVNRFYKELSELYTSPCPQEEKLRLRENILERMNTSPVRQALGIGKPGTKESWDIFHEIEVNNAFIAYFHTYTAYIPLVIKVWDKIDNPKEFIEFIKKTPAFSEEEAIRYFEDFLS